MNYEEIEQSLKILKFKKINQISEIDLLWRKETQIKYNNFRKGKISKKVLNSNLLVIAEVEEQAIIPLSFFKQEFSL